MDVAPPQKNQRINCTGLAGHRATLRSRPPRPSSPSSPGRPCRPASAEVGVNPTRARETMTAQDEERGLIDELRSGAGSERIESASQRSRSRTMMGCGIASALVLFAGLLECTVTTAEAVSHLADHHRTSTVSRHVLPHMHQRKNRRNTTTVSVCNIVDQWVRQAALTSPDGLSGEATSMQWLSAACRAGPLPVHYHTVIAGQLNMAFEGNTNVTAINVQTTRQFSLTADAGGTSFRLQANVCSSFDLSNGLKNVTAYFGFDLSRSPLSLAALAEVAVSLPDHSRGGHAPLLLTGQLSTKTAGIWYCSDLDLYDGYPAVCLTGNPHSGSVAADNYQLGHYVMELMGAPWMRLGPVEALTTTAIPIRTAYLQANASLALNATETAMNGIYGNETGLLLQRHVSCADPTQCPVVWDTLSRAASKAASIVPTDTNVSSDVLCTLVPGSLKALSSTSIFVSTLEVEVVAAASTTQAIVKCPTGYLYAELRLVTHDAEGQMLASTSMLNSDSKALKVFIKRMPNAQHGTLRGTLVSTRTAVVPSSAALADRDRDLNSFVYRVVGANLFAAERGGTAVPTMLLSNTTAAAVVATFTAVRSQLDAAVTVNVAHDTIAKFLDATKFARVRASYELSTPTPTVVGFLEAIEDWLSAVGVDIIVLSSGNGFALTMLLQDFGATAPLSSVLSNTLNAEVASLYGGFYDQFWSNEQRSQCEEEKFCFYNGSFPPNTTTVNSVQLAATFLCTDINLATVRSVTDVQWNVKTEVNNSFSNRTFSNHTQIPLFDYLEGVAFTGNVGPPRVSLKSTIAQRWWHVWNLVDCLFLGWSSEFSFWWWWFYGAGEYLEDNVFAQIAAAKAHNSNFVAVNGHSQVLDVSLDQINYDQALFDRLLTHRMQTTFFGLTKVFDDIVSNLVAPGQNVQDTGRAFCKNDTFVFQVETVSSLRVTLPGDHSGTTRQLGSDRLSLPMLISSTLRLEVTPWDVSSFRYNISFRGHTGVDGANVLMLHDMMGGPSQDNSTVRINVDLSSDTLRPNEQDVISEAQINVSMAPVVKLPGRGVQQVHAFLDDTMRSDYASPWCSANTDATNLSMACLADNAPTKHVTLAWVAYNDRSIPAHYVNALLGYLPRIDESFLRSPAVIPVRPMALPLSEISPLVQAEADRTAWLNTPSTRGPEVVTRMRKHICPSKIASSTTICVLVNTNHRWNNCTINFPPTPNLQMIVTTIKTGLVACGLGSVLFPQLAKYEASTNPPEVCGMVNLLTVGHGAIYNVTVTTKPSVVPGVVQFDGNFSTVTVPVFGVLEDAGMVSDSFFGPASHPLGHGRWSYSAQRDFLDNDIAPEELIIVLPRKIATFLWSGTHLSHNEQLNNVVVNSSIVAEGVHVEPYSNSTGTVSLQHDLYLTYGAVFQTPRLNGVSPTDNVSWHTIPTVASESTTIYRTVTADNNTFSLVLEAEDRLCRVSDAVSFREGCPDDMLVVSPKNISIPINLRIGARLNDTLLNDLWRQVPPPWNKMVSNVSVVPTRQIRNVPVVDQLAIAIDGIRWNASHWRIPTSVAIVPTIPGHKVDYFYNATFAPPRSRVILANTSVTVQGEAIATISGPGGIGIVPVHGSNITSRTRFFFSANQSVIFFTMERGIGGLASENHMFDVYVTSAHLNGTVVFPNETLDVIERGFHGGTGMLFSLAVNEFAIDSLNDTGKLAALNVYSVSFSGNLTQLMTRLSQTTPSDLCAMITDVVRVDSAVTSFNETFIRQPFLQSSFAGLYNTSFGTPLQSIQAKTCELQHILDVRMMCDALKAVYSKTVCTEPRLNSITHTLELPFRWSVVNLHQRDAIRIAVDELFSNHTYESFPFMKGDDGQVVLQFNASVAGVMHLDFSDPLVDRIDVRDFSSNLSVLANTAGNLNMNFGPVDFQSYDATLAVSSTAMISQPAGVAGGVVAIQNATCSASFISSPKLEHAPYCYIHVNVSEDYLATAGEEGYTLLQYLCGDSQLEGLLDQVLKENTFAQHVIQNPFRVTDQFRASTQALHDRIFGVGGVLPSGITLPLVGDAFELEFRRELATALASPQMLKEMSADLAELTAAGGASASLLSELTSDDPNITNTPSAAELRQHAVNDITALLCKWLRGYLLEGCPPAPVLAPPNDEGHTCLNGACVWPFHLGRKYPHTLSHLSNSLAAAGQLHLKASETESIESLIAWELNFAFAYSDRQGPTFEFPYPLALVFSAELDLEQDLKGELGSIDAELKADGLLNYSFAVTTGYKGLSSWIVKLVGILFPLITGMLKGCLGLQFVPTCENDLLLALRTVEVDLEKMSVLILNRMAASIYKQPGDPQCEIDKAKQAAGLKVWFREFISKFNFFSDILKESTAMFDDVQKAGGQFNCGIDWENATRQQKKNITDALNQGQTNPSLFVQLIGKFFATWDFSSISWLHEFQEAEAIKSLLVQILDALGKGAQTPWDHIGFLVSQITQIAFPLTGAFCALGINSRMEVSLDNPPWASAVDGRRLPSAHQHHLLTREPPESPPNRADSTDCSEMDKISSGQLKCVFTQLDNPKLSAVATEYSGWLSSSLGHALKNTCAWAAFLGNVGQESNGLTALTEEPCKDKYCGRGPLQISGANNYMFCAQKKDVCGCPSIFNSPTEASSGIIGVGTAACVWELLFGHSLTPDADGSLTGFLKTACRINQPRKNYQSCIDLTDPSYKPNGWVNRQRYWNNAKKCLGGGPGPSPPPSCIERHGHEPHVLTFPEIASLFVKKWQAASAELDGWSDLEVCYTAVAVARYQSGGGCTTAIHNNADNSADRGLWQLNIREEVSDDCAFDADCATGSAVTIIVHAPNFKSWTSYTSGKYRENIPAAKIACQAAAHGGAPTPAPTTCQGGNSRRAMHMKRFQGETEMKARSAQATGPSWNVNESLELTFDAIADVGLDGMKGPHWQANLTLEWAMLDWLSGRETRPIMHWSNISFCLGTFLHHVYDLLLPYAALIQELDRIFGKDGFLNTVVPLSVLLTGRQLTYAEFVEHVVKMWCDGDCIFVGIFEALLRYGSILDIVDAITEFVVVHGAAFDCGYGAVLPDFKVDSKTGIHTISGAQDDIRKILKKWTIPRPSSVSASAIETSVESLMPKLCTVTDSGISFPMLDELVPTLISLVGFDGGTKINVVEFAIHGAQMATHTPFGPYLLPTPPVPLTLVAEFSAVVGFAGARVVLTLDAFKQAFVDKDPLHLVRSLAMIVADSNGQPMYPLYGMVEFEAAVALDVWIFTIGFGAGIASTLQIGFADVEGNGLLSVGDVEWLVKTNQLQHAIIAHLGIDVVLELFAEAHIDLGFATVNWVVVDWKKFFPVWGHDVASTNITPLASGGTVHLECASSVAQPQFRLSGGAGTSLVILKDLSGRSEHSARHKSLPSSTVSFDGSLAGSYSVVVNGFYNTLNVPSDTFLTIILDVGSHNGSSVVTATNAFISLAHAALLSMPGDDGRVRLINISNPTPTMSVLISALRSPMTISTLPFNNITITGDAVHDYKHGMGIDLPCALDALSISVADTAFDIGNAAIHSVHGLAVTFEGGVNELSISGHPTLSSVMRVQSTPPGRYTTVFGGLGDDHIVIPTLSGLDSPLMFNGGGGIDGVEMSIEATAGAPTQTQVASASIVHTTAVANRSLYLNNVKMRVVTLVADNDAVSELTLAMSGANEINIINTIGNNGAQITHRMYGCDSASHTTFAFNGSGAMSVQLGRAGSVAEFAGAVSIQGSEDSGQDLTVVVDAGADPRTLRVEVQRNLVSIIDTASGQGELRLSLVRVDLLILHVTDYVLIDHGATLTKSDTEAIIYVHKHIGNVPPWFQPINVVRENRVHFASVSAAVSVFALTPVNVTFGEAPRGSTTAPWNDCDTGGIYCATHPLALCNAPIYIVQFGGNESFDENKTAVQSQLSFGSGTSSEAIDQHFLLHGNTISIANASGSPLAPAKRASSALCKRLALHGDDLCAKETSGPSTVQLGFVGDMEDVNPFFVSISVGGGNDHVYAKDTDFPLSVSFGGGNNKLSGSNLHANITVLAGAGTNISLMYPIAGGVIDFQDETLGGLYVHGDNHSINETLNAFGGGVLSGVSPDGGQLLLRNMDHDVELSIDSGVMSPCTLCNVIVPAAPVPPAPVVPARPLAINISTEMMMIKPREAAPGEYIYNATDCAGLPLRIVQLAGNGSHTVLATISSEACTVVMLGARDPAQVSRVVITTEAGFNQQMSFFREDESLHIFNSVTGSFSRVTHVNLKQLVVHCPAGGVFLGLHQAAPITNSIFYVPEPTVVGQSNSVESVGNAGPSAVVGVFKNIQIGPRIVLNNPVNPLNFTVHKMMFISANGSGTNGSSVANVSMDSGASSTASTQSLGAVGACVSQLTLSMQLSKASELVERYPISQWWCSELATLGVSNAVCLQSNCALHLMLRHHLYVRQGGSSTALLLNSTTAESVTAVQTAQVNTFSMFDSHTPMRLNQHGKSDQNPLAAFPTSRATYIEPFGPALLTWADPLVSRINTLTLWTTQAVETVPFGKNGGEVFIPVAGTPQQNLTCPNGFGRNDVYERNQLPVASQHHAAGLHGGDSLTVAFHRDITGMKESDKERLRASLYNDLNVNLPREINASNSKIVLSPGSVVATVLLPDSFSTTALAQLKQNLAKKQNLIEPLLMQKESTSLPGLLTSMTTSPTTTTPPDNGPCVTRQANCTSCPTTILPCDSNTDYCIFDLGDTAFMALDCHNATGTRIFVNFTLDPNNAPTVEIIAGPDSDLEVIVQLPALAAEIETNIPPPPSDQYVALNLRDATLKLTQVPRLKLASAPGGTLHLKGAFPVLELVTVADRTVLLPKDGTAPGWLGCHALLSNCTGCDFGPSVFGSPFTYVLAGANTSVSIWTNASNSGSVEINDGCVLPTALIPSAPLPQWLQTEALALNVSMPPLLSHPTNVYLVNAEFVILRDEINVTLRQLGGHVRAINVSRSSCVKLMDTVPWNGTTQVTMGSIWDPGGRYVLHVSSLGAESPTAVAVHVPLQHVNASCSSPGAVNWNFLPASLNLTMMLLCSGNVMASELLNSTNVVAAQFQSHLAYGAVSVRSAQSAMVDVVHGFSLAVNVDASTQLVQFEDRVAVVDVGVTNHTIVVVAASTVPTVLLDPARLGSVLMTGNGPVMLDRKPMFQASKRALVIDDGQAFSPSCVPPARCASVAWQEYAEDRFTPCFTKFDEFQCSESAVVALSYVSSASDGSHQLSCTEIDAHIVLSSQESGSNTVLGVKAVHAVVQATYWLGVGCAAVLGIAAHPSYMVASLWILAPLWTFAISDRGGDGDMAEFEYEARTMVMYIYARPNCFATGDTSTDTKAIILLTACAVSVVLLFIAAVTPLETGRDGSVPRILQRITTAQDRVCDVQGYFWGRWRSEKFVVIAMWGVMLVFLVLLAPVAAFAKTAWLVSTVSGLTVALLLTTNASGRDGGAMFMVLTVTMLAAVVYAISQHGPGHDLTPTTAERIAEGITLWACSLLCCYHVCLETSWATRWHFACITATGSDCLLGSSVSAMVVCVAIATAWASVVSYAQTSIANGRNSLIVLAFSSLVPFCVHLVLLRRRHVYRPTMPSMTEVQPSQSLSLNG